MALALFVGWGAIGTVRAQEAKGAGSSRHSLQGPLSREEGRFLLGVERISGVVGWYTRSVDENDFGRFERERRGAQLHVFAATAHVGDDRNWTQFSGTPRVTFDVLTDFGMTLGGFAAVLGSAGNEDLVVNGVEQEEITAPDSISVLTGLRMGWVVPLSPRFAFWPRAGAAYSLQHVLGPAGARLTVQVLQVNLEPTFFFAMAPHVGLLLHPFVDLGVAGSVKTSFVIAGIPSQSSTGSLRMHAGGATIGLVAHF